MNKYRITFFHDKVMILSLIVAMASNRVIGKKGDIPWHIPGEQKLFKEMTMGCPIIMGRKTWESIGRPLPGRTNIVISRNARFQADGCIVNTSVKQALENLPEDTAEAFIIGGGSLYKDTIAQAKRLYLTELLRDIEGDTFFPEFTREEFVELETREIESTEKYKFTILERKQ